MTTNALGDLRARLSGLNRRQVGKVADGLRAVLDALPEDGASLADVRQRDLIEAFLLGFDAANGRLRGEAKADPSKPESEWERLTMFSVLAEDYFVAARVIDAGAEGHAVSGSLERDELWRGMLKLAMLRKFFSPRDHVQLPKVAKALRACNLDRREDVEAAAQAIDDAWQKREVIDFDQLLGALLPEDDESDPIEVLLYGRIIHADASKFRHVRRLTDYDLSIVHIVAHADLQRALDLARFNVGQCMASGAVREPR